MVVLFYDVTIKDSNDKKKEFKTSYSHARPQSKTWWQKMKSVLDKKAQNEQNGAAEFYEDVVSDENSARPGWGTVIKRCKTLKSYLKRTNPCDKVVVMIKSLEALQAKNRADLYRQIGYILAEGACLYSEDESATFTREAPRGVSSDPKKLETALEKIEPKPGIVRVSRRNKERYEI